MPPPFEKKKSLGTRLKSMLFTGLPLLGLPSYKFSFRSSVQKNGPPGEGRHEGLVPRNDVRTNGFIRFSLARTLAPILFVPLQVEVSGVCFCLYLYLAKLLSFNLYTIFVNTILCFRPFSKHDILMSALASFKKHAFVNFQLAWCFLMFLVPFYGDVN